MILQGAQKDLCSIGKGPFYYETGKCNKFPIE